VTALSHNTTLYIGWDVGGWEGSHDGLAALRWAGDGHLELCAEARRVRLNDELGNEFGVEDLLAACGVAQPRDRVVIGIDAPPGWPTKFVRLMEGSSQQTGPYLPGRDGEIENRLAYRHTDPVVRRRCDKKPLSAAFDKLGNNATNAITLCQLLRRNSGAVVVPQEQDAGQHVVICEAYPAMEAGRGQTWRTYRARRRRGAPRRHARSRHRRGGRCALRPDGRVPRQPGAGAGAGIAEAMVAGGRVPHGGP
jgi:hypothetical protein